MTSDENKTKNSNRTRDHLANERTYLAWVRTAVALLGFGILVLRLRPFAPVSSPSHGHGWEVGSAFCLAGLAMIPFANRRYFQVLEAIEKDDFEPSRRAISWCSAAITVIGVAVLIYILFSASPDVSALPR